MNVAASGRTWEEASSPDALRLTRAYEEAWQRAELAGSRLDPAEFLSRLRAGGEVPGARLAILRTDLSLRWDAGDRVSALWYLDRFPDLGDDCLVALVYEEFCLLEEDGQAPETADFLARYSALAEPLRRVLDIHCLIGSATVSNSMSSPGLSVSVSPARSDPNARVVFPEAGQTIGGFYLVEELGRGAFARVFLARERQLADRPVALKVSRRGSREPQALARLQHTHIVPVHSHRVDPATGLHLLCMPYFGRITLARVLAEVGQDDEMLSGSALLDVLDRLADPADSPPAGRSACRAALAERSYVQAIAWWAARLAEALEHAHDRGVLHRDIKPSNVLVIDDGMPMLLDFNLARESVLAEDEEGEAAEATLGGTVDYMAPEHLESLAEGLSDRVDRRSDIYGLGVLLYEAIVGKKPFLPPRKTHSVIDSLLRAAAERRHDPGILFSGDVEVPAPLRAVIRRCLEPEPEDRYQRAAELAADLRAIADDLPLCHVREPIFSRVNRRLRRNRRRLAGAAIILLAGAAVLGAYLNYQFERYERFEEVRGLYQTASTAIDDGEFSKAQILLDNAAQRASHSELGTFRHLLKWETFWGFGGKLGRKLDQLWMNPGLEDLEDDIRFKASMSKKIVIARDQADNLLKESESLRFRLIGLGEDLPGAINELKRLLAPFQVLTSKEDWTKLDYIWDLLDETRQQRLRREVNELLFLWMVQVETSVHKLAEPAAAAGIASDPATLRQALKVCDRVLTFAEPREPWLALRALLQEQRTGPARDGIGPAARNSAALTPKTLNGEPVHVGNEKSALACFQWGLLCSSQGRSKRAIEWMQQAVWLDWSNYWYQFYLAYLLGEEGLADEALDHYSAAVACQPDSPWVRFNRARIYRANGRWSWALDDLLMARKLMGNRPESLQVALEIGVLHWSLGNFAQAANEYRGIIAAAPESAYACAARLNLANIDAESGREESARATYEALLKTHPDDRPARLGRANLSLRQGRPEDALTDLDVLLRPGVTIADRDDVLATRAIARLLSKQRSEAVADAALAQRLRPCPAHERLLQRTLLAAGRFDELQLQCPGEVLLLPAAGAWLTADLRAAATELSRRASGPESLAYRVLLNRAVILSALGDHRTAIAVSGRALAMAALSPDAHLVRARVLHRAGDFERAFHEIDVGLKLKSDQPGLLELRGVMLTEAGNAEEGLVSLDQAISLSPNHFAYLHKATALVALKRYDEAVRECSLALKRDPELPQAYLSRAHCYVELLIWDRALADLEQAAAWAHGDLRLQTGIMLTYAKCLQERPEHIRRWLLLLQRTFRLGWDVLTRTSVSTGVFR